MGAVRIEIDDEVRSVRLELHFVKGLPSFATESMRVSVSLTERKPEESLTIEVEHPFGVAAQYDNSSTASWR